MYSNLKAFVRNPTESKFRKTFWLHASDAGLDASVIAFRKAFRKAFRMAFQMQFEPMTCFRTPWEEGGGRRPAENGDRPGGGGGRKKMETDIDEAFDCVGGMCGFWI